MITSIRVWISEDFEHLFGIISNIKARWPYYVSYSVLTRVMPSLPIIIELLISLCFLWSYFRIISSEIGSQPDTALLNRLLQVKGGMGAHDCHLEWSALMTFSAEHCRIRQVETYYKYCYMNHPLVLHLSGNYSGSYIWKWSCAANIHITGKGKQE